MEMILFGGLSKEMNMSSSRILIVDDSAVFRKSIKKIIEPIDAEIVLANDGQEGLNLVQSAPFDLSSAISKCRFSMESIFVISLKMIQ
jgi:CheY-like chemotaxis protein